MGWYVTCCARGQYRRPSNPASLTHIASVCVCACVCVDCSRADVHVRRLVDAGTLVCGPFVDCVTCNRSSPQTVPGDDDDAEAADASSRLMVLHMVRRVRRPFCVLALPANLVACVLWSAASG